MRIDKRKSVLGLKYAICAMFFLFAIMPLALTAQNQEEIIRIDGKQYYVHRVAQGETLYGLSKTYKVSVEDIIQANPDVSEGLKADAVINIPKQASTDEENAPQTITTVTDGGKPQTQVATAVTLDGKTRHEVQKGETIYGISRRYGISEQELVGMNPGIENGLRAGQTLIIPTTSTQQNKVHETQQHTTTEVAANNDKQGGTYKVKKNENLYDIARMFGVDVADIKAANKGLTNYPVEGLPIVIPERKNADSFFVHRVEENSKTSDFVRKWRLTIDEFSAINSSVGRRVYANQAVLIPMLKQTENTATIIPTVTEVTNQDTQDTQENDTQQSSAPCEILQTANMTTFDVALLIPLYLDEIDDMNIDKDAVEKVRKARPFKFLHFYEGFMTAMNDLAEEGLNVRLKVIDVDEDVNKAHNAVSQLKKSHVDLIVGPFFSRGFAVVSEYARQNNITIVNPLSGRSNIVEGNPNVIKVKPDMASQIDALCELLAKNYSEDLCVLFVPNGEENNATILNYAKTIKNRVKNDTANVKVLPYDEASFTSLVDMAAGYKNTVVVAINDKLVFATQMINTLNKTVENIPITLVGLPEWSDFDNLLVDNLMRMNTIYFSDYFVDYTNDEVEAFVNKFRNSYKFEPDKYAFVGYDVANYFIKAMSMYGSNPCDCLHDYTPNLMHTKFNFTRSNENNGLQNTYWNIYQYDNTDTTLKPLNR